MTAVDDVVELIPDEPAEPAEPAAVPTVELLGERFPVRDEGVSLLALMKFATIAKRQAARRERDPASAGADDMEGLAALYALLRSCIAPDAWDAFEDHANERGASSEDLMRVVSAAVQANAGRPTRRLSASPGGQSTTGTSSAAGSSSPGSPVQVGDLDVQRRLEAQGRPDLAVAVLRAREASTRSSTG